MPRQKAHDLTKKKKEEKKGKKGTKKPTFTKTFKKSGKEAMTGLQIKNLAFKVASKFLESASVEELNQAALDLIESRALNDGRFYALTSDVKPLLLTYLKIKGLPLSQKGSGLLTRMNG
jgi:hypothetical protein